MSEYSADEWAMIGIRLFGADRDLWKFKCPVCGIVQSVADYVEAGMNPNFARRYAGVHCIGNYYPDKAACSHTVDMLIQTGVNDSVSFPDGSKIAVFPFAPMDVFEWAKPSEARAAIGAFDKLAKCA